MRLTGLGSASMPHKNLPRVASNRCRFISELVRGRNVLDIGCVEHNLQNRDRGHWLHEYLRKTAKTLVGLDYETEAINALADEGYDVVVGNATCFDLGRTFETVVAGEVIEHIDNPGLFLDCVHRHLTTSGEIILTTPNANCLIYFLENLLLGHEIDNPDHVSIYSPRTISLVLSRHGFEVTNVVFLAENTMHCHRSHAARVLVGIKLLAQRLLASLQPSVCHHMLVIARKMS